MRSIRSASFIIAIVVLAFIGCAQPTASSTASNTAKNDKPSNSLIDETLTAGSGGELPSANSAATSQQPVNSAPTGQPATEQVRAGVGVGKSGQKFDQYQKDSVQKIISTPAREFFRVKERLVFEVQIPEAMKYYKVEHDDKGPRSHEEFMREIIEFNKINLPELPAGQRYVYNPETEELMIERPAQ